jgi:hypothetical protein
MKPPKGVILVSAKYAKDYKILFKFSNGKESLVDFKPIIKRDVYCKEFLDVTKFKKICIDKNKTDIYWGKDWNMCFHIETYYGEKKVIPLSRKEIKSMKERLGLKGNKLRKS